jgi:hypothetical protein
MLLCTWTVEATSTAVEVKVSCGTSQHVRTTPASFCLPAVLVLDPGHDAALIIVTHDYELAC